MNFRSISFRLIVWYAGLLLLLGVLFGFYTYSRLEHYLRQVLLQSLSSRAERISDTLIANITTTGEKYVSDEIKARYSPELNDRFIRVLRPDGSLLYVSGRPNDNSFDPNKVAVTGAIADAPAERKEVTPNGTRLLIVAVSCRSADQRFLVEVGASTKPIDQVLASYLATLAIGLPVFIGIAIWGGYLLIKRALAPVQRITAAAREITLHHLDRPLPEIHTGDEIESLSTTLNQMIQGLRESFKTSSRFTSDASHELRTPLTIMRGELEALQLSGEFAPDVNETLNSLLEETNDLTRIVEGLLALSRLDAEQAQKEQTKVDFSELVETTTEQISPLAEEKQIALSCLAAKGVEVDGDRARLKQMIVNLLDNAIKYTPCGGEVQVRVRAMDSSATLNVEDTGPGISKEALPHIFKRFFRSDEARSSDTDGIGLGLSIVQSICIAHGGDISVATRSPSGCSFTIQLPLASRN